jgi:hypothetical protein
LCVAAAGADRSVMAGGGLAVWRSSGSQRGTIEVAIWKCVAVEIRIFSRFFSTRSVSEGPCKQGVLDEVALSLVPILGR